jgi:putative transcriptional regulator
MNTIKLAKALEQIKLHSEGKVELKITKVAPPQVDVKSIRAKTGLSQKDFADAYGFSASTIRNWEQGSRVPDGPARILLRLILNDPKRVKKDIERVLLEAA